MEGKDTQREVEVSAANSSQMKGRVGWMSDGAREGYGGGEAGVGGGGGEWRVAVGNG